MAISAISPANRSVTAPEALRAPVERARETEAAKGPDPQRTLQLNQARQQQEEARRVSRENKDNGNDSVSLYQAPGLKQTQPDSPKKGTLVNVTA